MSDIRVAKVYVITWHYSDGSAADVVGCYEDKDSAWQVLRLLHSAGDSAKQYRIFYPRSDGSYSQEAES